MQDGGSGSSVKRLRVLVVEDESIVAMLMEDMLADIGHEVSAVASTVDAAMEQATSGSFDVAILDVNLDGKPSYSVADVLASRGVPVVFATGYGARAQDHRFADAPVLPKPFAVDSLRVVLSQFDPRS
jgi:CheY-like chemotaxis protein